MRMDVPNTIESLANVKREALSIAETIQWGRGATDTKGYDEKLLRNCELIFAILS